MNFKRKNSSEMFNWKAKIILIIAILYFNQINSEILINPNHISQTSSINNTKISDDIKNFKEIEKNKYINNRNEIINNSNGNEKDLDLSDSIPFKHSLSKQCTDFYQEEIKALQSDIPNNLNNAGNHAFLLTWGLDDLGNYAQCHRNDEYYKSFYNKDINFNYYIIETKIENKFKDSYLFSRDLIGICLPIMCEDEESIGYFKELISSTSQYSHNYIDDKDSFKDNELEFKISFINTKDLNAKNKDNSIFDYIFYTTLSIYCGIVFGIIDFLLLFCSNFSSKTTIKKISFIKNYEEGDNNSYDEESFENTIDIHLTKGDSKYIQKESQYYESRMSKIESNNTLDNNAHNITDNTKLSILSNNNINNNQTLISNSNNYNELGNNDNNENKVKNNYTKHKNYDNKHDIINIRKKKHHHSHSKHIRNKEPLTTRNLLKRIKSFSNKINFFKNLNKLFLQTRVRTEDSEFRIIEGIRVICSLYIVLLHCFIFLNDMPLKYKEFEVDIIQSFAFQIIANGSFVVDIFFSLGGFILAYLILKKLNCSEFCINTEKKCNKKTSENNNEENHNERRIENNKKNFNENNNEFNIDNSIHNYIEENEEDVSSKCSEESHTNDYKNIKKENVKAKRKASNSINSRNSKSEKEKYNSKDNNDDKDNSTSSITDKNSNKSMLILFIKIILSRFLRIWPNYFFVFLIYWRIFPKLIQGPVSNYMFDLEVQSCNKQFPFMIFFLENYTYGLYEKTSPVCMGWYWFIPIEILLFVIGVVFLFIYFFFSKKLFYFIWSSFSGIMIALEVMRFARQDEDFGVNIMNQGELLKSFVNLQIYFPNRCFPYLIGILFGIMYFEFKEDSVYKNLGNQDNNITNENNSVLDGEFTNNNRLDITLDNNNISQVKIYNNNQIRYDNIDNIPPSQSINFNLSLKTTLHSKNYFNKFLSLLESSNILSTIVLLLGFLINFTVIFIVYYTYNEKISKTVGVTYNILWRKLFTLGFFLILLVLFRRENSSLLAKLLKLQYFQLHSKITYSVYLIHPIIIKYFFYTSNDYISFEIEDIVSFAISFFFLSSILGVLVTLLFEIPLVSLILDKEKTNKNDDN